MKKITLFFRWITFNNVTPTVLFKNGFNPIYGDDYSNSYKFLRDGTKLIVNLWQDFFVLYDGNPKASQEVIKGVTRKKLNGFI